MMINGHVASVLFEYFLTDDGWTRVRKSFYDFHFKMQQELFEKGLIVATSDRGRGEVLISVDPYSSLRTSIYFLLKKFFAVGVNGHIVPKEPRIEYLETLITEYSKEQ